MNMNLIWYEYSLHPDIMTDYSVIEAGDLRKNRVVEKPEAKGLSTFS
jgi:hypothetical protein